MDNGPLYETLSDNPILSNLKINEVLKDGQWDWSVLQYQPPGHIKIYLSSLSSLQVLINQQKKDSTICTSNNNGKFTISSAWNLLRQRNRVSSYNANIWQKGVPFKMSFMILRAVHNKVATDERISSLGIVVDSRRSCCTSFSDIQGPETTNHLFYSDQYAQQVWNFFIGRLGIEYRNNNPRTLILNCWK
ncbi:uncharacterized protein [Nicotiana tomentosiformis]|uniref:uncharacterized protein n=1 Tax=Nicotiana tomentosiformis TaxID=4098 RepID=UPI00388C8A03